jgi:hypothetical protein
VHACPSRLQFGGRFSDASCGRDNSAKDTDVLFGTLLNTEGNSGVDKHSFDAFVRDESARTVKPLN